MCVYHCQHHEYGKERKGVCVCVCERERERVSVKEGVYVFTCVFIYL